ncbi:hypothetical protein, partial [Pseudomonas syringae]|uniref:hypothetical protein n=1 Tax=Pseudomonas syringae TaxID=317 RepID=UPI0021809972
IQRNSVQSSRLAAAVREFQRSGGTVCDLGSCSIAPRPPRKEPPHRQPRYNGADHRKYVEEEEDLKLLERIKAMRDLGVSHFQAEKHRDQSNHHQADRPEVQPGLPQQPGEMKRLQMRVRHGRRQQHIHLPPSGNTELINDPDSETAGREDGDQAAESRGRGIAAPGKAGHQTSHPANQRSS